MDPQRMTRLQAIFREFFELPPGADVSQLQAGVTEKWDSLAHVELVAAIESEFGLSIDLADSLEMTSYQRAVELLNRQAAR